MSPKFYTFSNKTRFKKKNHDTFQIQLVVLGKKTTTKKHESSDKADGASWLPLALREARFLGTEQPVVNVHMNYEVTRKQRFKPLTTEHDDVLHK